MSMTYRRLGPEALQVRDKLTDHGGMKRFLAAALVAAMFFVGIPAAFATDDAPPDTGGVAPPDTDRATPGEARRSDPLWWIIRRLP